MAISIFVPNGLSSGCDDNFDRNVSNWREAMTAASFRHLVLTRFNVKRHADAQPPPDAWLRSRIDIFRDWCLPSIRAQSVRPDHWLIFCDAASPSWFLDELGSMMVAGESIALVSGVGTPASYAAAVAEVLRDEEFLITTRLDNDDAIARDFIERVQATFTGQECEFINFTLGAQYCQGRFFARLDPSNAFITLIERRSREHPKTVLVDWHNRVDRHGAVRRVRSHFAWLQHVHGGNLANVARGLPVYSASVLRHFALSVPAEKLSFFALFWDGLRTCFTLGWRVLSSTTRLRWILQSLNSRKS